MKLIVVGASGFIGGHILRAAREAGVEALGTQSTARRQDLTVFDLRRDRLEDEFRDACLEGQVHVIVAAAFSQIDRCLLERDTSHAVNVDGTIRLLRDAVSLGAVPVFLSSSFVFDGRRGDYGDHATHSPISEYGRQKAEVERFVMQELPGALVLRLDKTVGDDPAEKHLLSEWWDAVQARRPIRCIQDQQFSPTFVDDVARGVVLACRQELRGVLNLTNSECLLRSELAEQFVAESGAASEVVQVSQSDLGFADLRPEKSSLDSSRFVRATGLRFTPMHQVMMSFLDKVRHLVPIGRA
jgi:dTDP-4-dehydrorhamnose reductase